MAEPKNPLASFPEYFSIRLAVTPPYRQETFRIRFRVYCEEFGYEPAERFPNHMETDGFDGFSTHCLITHLASGMPAGCVRMCPATVNGADQPLPYDQCCADSLDPVAMAGVTAPRDRRCEASRFAVDGAFRRRSGEALTRFGEIASLDLSDLERRTFPLISVALMLAGTAMAENVGRPYMFAVMEPFLPRLLKRSGMVFHRMGRDLDHHGIRAVYVTDTRDFVRDMDGEFRKLYDWIHGELDTQDLTGA
ncbi:MAG TPA: PEP-CTERM/exosortase system-associated acyltransferase [Lamprocystis sp. (in: g-proteobacteria)]|nr:PEP-CTERM/exosortase system-associated acyltransferase [Lamprocystis sp. (in: g-proteobacteria)]